MASNMTFDIDGKVALITGGASGIGFSFAKELLKNGLRGVTLADVNEDFGKRALTEIEAEFGAKKAIFVKTDIGNYQNFEGAFKKTIEVFKNIDILINNAAILNDKLWEKEVATNVNGTIHGVLLGLEHYIPKYKSGAEGVIVNISSVSGIKELPCLPIYTATKFAIFGLSKAWGHPTHFDRTKVRVVVMCPGSTETPMKTAGTVQKVLAKSYVEMPQENKISFPTQTAECVAFALVTIIKSAKTGTAWVVEAGEPPYEFIIPERKSFAPVND